MSVNVSVSGCDVKRFVDSEVVIKILIFPNEGLVSDNSVHVGL